MAFNVTMNADFHQILFKQFNTIKFLKDCFCLPAYK